MGWVVVKDLNILFRRVGLEVGGRLSGTGVVNGSVSDHVPVLAGDDGKQC